MASAINPNNAMAEPLLPQRDVSAFNDKKDDVGPRAVSDTQTPPNQKKRLTVVK